MVADFMYQNMTDNVGQALAAVAPEVENGAAIEINYVRQAPDIENAAARQVYTVIQAQNVEGCLQLHFLNDFITRKVFHLDDDIAGKLADLRRQACMCLFSKARDVFQRWRNRRGDGNAPDQLTVVSRAMQHAAGGAVLDLGEIGAHHIFKADIEVARQIGDIPHDIAQLLGDIGPALGRGKAVVVAHHLLDVLYHFACFTSEAQRGVDGAKVVIVDRGGAGNFLVFIKSHNGLSPASIWATLAVMQEKITPRIAVVTGATSGIGLELVRGLASAGWRVIGVARNPERGRRMTEILRAQTGNPSISFVTADLSLMKEAAKAGAQIVREHPHIDLLINNAGAIYDRRQETAEGHERTFALNHLGYAAFTQAMRPALEATAQARVVNVASAAHFGVKLDFDDLEMSKGRFASWRQYQRSKLMTILYTRALARRLGGNVTVNSLHPGFVATRFGSDNSRLWRFIMKLMMYTAIKPAESAKGVLQVALSPEYKGVSGAYFDRGRPAIPSAEAQNDASAEQLWQVTENLLSKA